jgi:alanyl-tRNA synthetase
MKSHEIREAFINYFKKKGHTHLPSSPVIPHNDPSLLFVNAGMNQFKDIFLGKQPALWPSAVTCQKCIRVGGKHNDLENVGHTSRHLTFFEMVGNFSFGDYFKKEAIDMAFDFVMHVLQFDSSHIWATVLHDDEESFRLWKNYLPEERICRMGEKDNFWSMGDTGPCGSCSELLYDRGEEYSKARSPAEDIEGERFFEFWNLVFMEFNRDASGKLSPLPKKCVDTGAGLERLVLLKNGNSTLFETDVLRSLIYEVEKLSSVTYNAQEVRTAPAFHVIADHLRALVFAIADGVEPSNLDRGYVLRKVLRRACRYGKILGLERPFLGELTPHLIHLMKETYPELIHAQHRIQEILLREEESFLRTLKRGGGLLQEIITHAKTSQCHISGEDAFKLKDTYGLPLEEILLLAKDDGLTVDLRRFEELEHEAKLRSKSAHKKEMQTAESSFVASFVKEKGPSTFTGYTLMGAEAVVTGIIKGGKEVTSLYEGEEGEILLNATPFYAEMGGQIGDQGILSTTTAEFAVLDCTSPYPEATLHQGVQRKGSLHVGDLVEATIDATRRIRIQNNHTATHLLHWALKSVLGAHVQQAGSVVEPTRLRFDFRHHKALTDKELIEIENIINEKILQNNAITTYELRYDEVKQRSDIQQMFGEKYGEKVRVVDIDFSKELCGGTHTTATGTLGQFRIVKESSIATGVRRIEAVTGMDALEFGRNAEITIKEISSLVKAQPGHLEDKIAQLLEIQRNMEQELKGLTQKQLQEEVRTLHQHIEQIGNYHLLAAEVQHSPKELADVVIQKEEPIVLVFIQRQEEKCAILIRVSKSYVAKGIKAADLLKELGPLLEAKGGGKDELAQGSGSRIENIAEALKHTRKWIQETGHKHS